MSEEFRLKSHPTVVAASAFVARGAVVVGDVVVGEQASVWFSAVVRGDTESIRVGARSNIQDGAVVHADPGFPSWIGDDVTIGHRAIVHGSQIGAQTLVGMGAILMNGVKVGPRCLIGAGALLTTGREFEADSLILGSPAKAVRKLTEAELADVIDSARHYVDASRAFLAADWQDPGFR